MKSNTTDLIGRYEILAELGRGAMGIVYKAHDPKIDRIVAVKTISLFDLAPSDELEYRARFYEEARTAGRLSHPGIVTVFDVEPSPAEGQPYIVMEYVDGQPLSKLLAENDGRLPLGQAVLLAEEVAKALHLAHSQGVIHRDIKPENILVTPEGRAKIADFGIARLDRSQLTLPGRALGSPAYMSPEQLDGEKIDGRSDLYSLGVVLYTMLTGHRPFQGNSTATVCFKVANRDALPISAWNLESPPELDELVGRAMAKDPAQRFQSGEEMAYELRRFREQHDVEPQPLASIQRMIGQESVMVAPAVLAERGSDSLRARVAVAASLQKEEPVAVAPRATGTPGNALPPRAARTSSSPSSPLTRAALTKAAGWTAACVLVVAGFAVWTKHRHSSGNELASTETATRTASPDPAISSLPANTAEDSSESRNAEPPQPAKPVDRAAAAAPKKMAPPTQHHAQAIFSRGSSSDKTDSPPPGDVTVRMIHMSDLNVTIEHGFTDAHASILVDNREVYAEELRGEKKRRALLFSHTQGNQSGTITILPGKHDIVVNVRSAADSYDATERLTQSFSPGSTRTLLIKCDKRKNRLQLSIK
jgi:serine/threonine protein kinase